MAVRLGEEPTDSPWKWFFERPDGLTFDPPVADQTTAFFLHTANEGATELQRVSAIIALMRSGHVVVVSLGEE